MKGVLRDHGLTIALLALFSVSLGGQMITGSRTDHQFRIEHGQALIGFGAYVESGAFLSSLFENWESEFLQMWAFVMLTAWLYQRGSPESKDPDKAEPQDRDPALDAASPDAPWPVRAGGAVRTLYSHSLGLALLALFVAAFIFHWVGSTRAAAEESLAHGRVPEGLLAHLGSAAFWFESFQNWQSEFLSAAVLIVLSIGLRERGSPESKPVAAPHGQTGAG